MRAFLVVVWVWLCACAGAAGGVADADADALQANAPDTDAVDADPTGPAADVDDADPIGPDAAQGDAPFFAFDAVHAFELRVTAAEWRDFIDHMRAYAAVDDRLRSGRFFRATLVHNGPSGGQVLTEVGFRTRGNTTRVIPEDEDGVYRRAHFRLDFNRAFTDEPGSAAADTRRARRFHGLRALNLKWADDEDDPSKIRERYSYDLFGRFGVPAPRTTAARLTFVIGGEAVDFGVYTAIEPIDESFLERHFGPGGALAAGGDDGDLYKCLWVNEGPATLEPITNPRALGVKDWETNYRPAYDLKTNETASDHAALLRLIDRLAALSGDALKGWLDAHFEVDLFLRALAVNVVVGMPDDYWAMGNNYYLYFPPTGRAVFIPYDYDHGLGGGWCGTPEWSCEGIATADPYTWKNLNAAFGDPATRHPLVDRILAIDAYRDRYTAHLAALVDPDGGLFDYADYAARFETLRERYAPWLANDPGEGETMVDDPQTRWYFETRTRTLRERLGLPDR